LGGYIHILLGEEICGQYIVKTHPPKNKKTKPTRVPVKVVFVNMVILDLVIS
jgi:hypothetical protein